MPSQTTAETEIGGTAKHLRQQPLTYTAVGDFVPLGTRYWRTSVLWLVEKLSIGSQKLVLWKRVSLRWHRRLKRAKMQWGKTVHFCSFINPSVAKFFRIPWSQYWKKELTNKMQGSSLRALQLLPVCLTLTSVSCFEKLLNESLCFFLHCKRSSSTFEMILKTSRAINSFSITRNQDSWCSLQLQLTSLAGRVLIFSQ